MIRRCIYTFAMMMIVLAGLLTASPKPAFACDCGIISPSAKLEAAGAVFVGTVKQKGWPSWLILGQTREYTFEVEQAWKGIDKKRITIQSYNGSGASCGYSFKLNKTYLVYAYYDRDHKLTTNLCSGNKPIAQAKEEIKELGVGVPAQSLDRWMPGAAGAMRYVLYMVAALAVCVLVYARYRRGKKMRRQPAIKIDDDNSP